MLAEMSSLLPRASAVAAFTLTGDRLYKEDNKANRIPLLMGIMASEALASLVPGLAACGLRPHLGN